MKPEANMPLDRTINIQFGRDMVKAAFRYSRKPQSSATAYFSGQQRPPAPKRKASLYRRRHHATPTRPSGTSRPVLIDNQKMHGFVHRHLSELPQVQFEWLQFRYRPPGTARTEYSQYFIRTFYCQYELDHLAGCKHATRQTVRGMVELAMAQEAWPEANIKPRHGHSDRNWRKTYQPHWKRICSTLAQVDRDALYTVGCKLADDVE